MRRLLFIAAVAVLTVATVSFAQSLETENAEAPVQRQCQIIGPPEGRVCHLPDDLGEAVITCVPVRLVQKDGTGFEKGFRWMDGDGFVIPSETVRSAAERRRAAKTETTED